jgi:hypothetical protein
LGDYDEIAKNTLLFEHFSGVRNLVQTLGKRALNNHAMSGKCNSGERGTDWTGTRNLEEAFNLLEKGWEDPIKDIDRGVVKNNKDLKISAGGMKTGIVGFAPCVPNAILGLPNSMMTRDQVMRKNRILTIGYANNSYYGTDAQDFVKGGVAICSIINRLELSGIRVAVKAFLYSATESKENVFCTVDIKNWREPLDLKRVTFPLCNASWERRVGFKYLETLPNLTDHGYSFGYGTDIMKKLNHDELHQYVVKNKILDENSVYITLEDCMQEDFNIEKIMEKFGLDKYI